MASKHTELSKFLSYVLRHSPDAIGIELDREGWTDIDGLVTAARQTGRSIDQDLIRSVVESSDKKRFTISDDGSRIRAAQGHSSKSVSITLDEKIPPELLFHGTATRFLDSIKEHGLRPGDRHYVHLSQDIATATAVGQRYGKPVVLTIQAAEMVKKGHKFFQADNGVWLTLKVPHNFFHVDT